jgi:hypothetical protein
MPGTSPISFLSDVEKVDVVYSLAAETTIGDLTTDRVYNIGGRWSHTIWVSKDKKVSESLHDSSLDWVSG